MSRKYFSYIFLTFLLFVFLFFFTEPSKEEKVDLKYRLLEKINVEDIKKIKITSTKDELYIELIDGVWSIPSKDNYRANLSQIRLLLLQLLELEVSQKVTSRKTNYAKLGVSDDSPGKSVIFYDDEQKEIGGVFLGVLRKAKSKQASFAQILSGQYLRKKGDPQVYLIPQQIEFTAQVEPWLDLGLANVLSSRIKRLEQYTLKNSIYEEDFALVRGEEEKLILDEPLPASSNLDSSYLSQISSALENSRFMNVSKASEPEQKEINYDFRTVYQLDSGVIYTVYTAEGNETFYAKIDITHLAAENEEENEVREKEASKLASFYNKWIYELPEYQGKKFRVRKNDVIG